MKAITSITSDPKQALTIVTDEGASITLTLEFVASQRGWFYSVGFPGWTGVSRRRLVNSPNMLRQFRGVIPFGLMCSVTDGQEPIYQDDFSTGRAVLFVMNASDISEIEAYIRT